MLQNETNSKLHGINFITICPSYTDTPMLTNLDKKFRLDFLEEAIRSTNELLPQT